MGIFSEMHAKRQFDSEWEYRELRRMLSEAIARGYVEQVPVMKPNRFSPWREWYRDRETGEIFCLDPPEERIRGWWDRIDPKDLIDPEETVQ